MILIKATDREYFNRALMYARTWKLEWEFLCWYKKARKEGNDIPTSCEMALCEWDM